MVVERIVDIGKRKKTIVRWFFTFVLVNLAWVIFKADTLAEAGLFFSRFFEWGTGVLETSLMTTMNELVEIRVLCRFGLQMVVDKMPFLPLVLFVVASMGIAFGTKNTQERVENFCYSGKQMVFTVLMLFWGIVSLTGVSTFLYSNF